MQRTEECPKQSSHKLSFVIHIRAERSATSATGTIPAYFPPEVIVDAAFESPPAVSVPLSCFARVTNASKVFPPDAGAFTEKTMPCPQWLVCLQKTHMGAVYATT